ncbi:MAG TPA: tRNA (cytidine(34)-2'-O)-methyltransferase [Bacilli bacterium]|nr:tRNA (cytidine(34)-2'-O)-methyltransferase [Bacilli bacterium]
MGTINLVLYQPEIPQNTGNIMRTCLATNTTLHLIEPLGFSLGEKEVKRSGANYIKDVHYILYPNWEDFLAKNTGEMYFLSRYGLASIHNMDVSQLDKDYYFVLGKESSGIPLAILQDNLDRCIRLPMTDKVRALNVSNVAAIIVYEALRQQNFLGLQEFEPETLKGKDFLLR